MTPGEVELRDAAAADVPLIEEIVERGYRGYVAEIGFRPRPMLDDYEALVRNGSVTVAERGAEVVGLIVLKTTEEGFAIDNVAIDPAAQGTGVGGALLAHAEREAAASGFASIYLFTHEKMTANQALYAHRGYEEYDRRRHGPAVLVYMRKRLPAPGPG